MPRQRRPTTWKPQKVKLVQGGADAVIEGSFATDANEETGEAFLIHEIDYEPDPSWEQDGFAEFQVCGESVGAALKAHDDEDILDYCKVDRRLTTSGTFETKLPITHKREHLVKRKTLYVAFDSTTTGLTATVYVTIWYENVQVPADKMALAF